LHGGWGGREEGVGTGEGGKGDGEIGMRGRMGERGGREESNVRSAEETTRL